MEIYLFEIEHEREDGAVSVREIIVSLPRLSHRCNDATVLYEKVLRI